MKAKNNVTWSNTTDGLYAIVEDGSAKISSLETAQSALKANSQKLSRGIANLQKELQLDTPKLKQPPKSIARRTEATKQEVPKSPAKSKGLSTSLISSGLANAKVDLGGRQPLQSIPGTKPLFNESVNRLNNVVESGVNQTSMNFSVKQEANQETQEQELHHQETQEQELNHQETQGTQGLQQEQESQEQELSHQETQGLQESQEQETNHQESQEQESQPQEQESQEQESQPPTVTYDLTREFKRIFYDGQTGEIIDSIPTQVVRVNYNADKGYENNEPLVFEAIDLSSHGYGDAPELKYESARVAESELDEFVIKEPLETIIVDVITNNSHIDAAVEYFNSLDINPYFKHKYDRTVSTVNQMISTYPDLSECSSVLVEKIENDISENLKELKYQMTRNIDDKTLSVQYMSAKLDNGYDASFVTHGFVPTIDALSQHVFIEIINSFELNGVQDFLNENELIFYFEIIDHTTTKKPNGLTEYNYKYRWNLVAIGVEPN